MADERAKSDANYKGAGVVGGYSSSDAIGATSPTIIILRVDPITGRLLVDASSTTAVADGDAVDVANTGTIIFGSDGANYQVITTDSDGHIQVDVLTGGGGGTQYTEGDTDATIVGTAIMWEDGGNTLATVSAANPLPVLASIDTTGLATDAKQDAILSEVESLTNTTNPATVYPYFWNGASFEGFIGYTGVGTSIVVNAALPAGSNNIGDVDVASSALPTGAATSAKQDTIIGHVDGIETLIGTTNTTLATIDGRVDGIEGLLTTIDADTSNLSVVGGGTEATAIRVTIANNSTGVLSIDDNGSTVSIDDGGGVITVDGTVAVTNSDITSIKTAVEILDNAISGSEMQVDLASAIPAGTNAIGKLLAPDIDVTAHTNYAKKYYTSAGAATDGIVWSPAAGKRWHAVVIHFQVSADCTVTLEDDKAGGDEVVWKGEYKAGSGHTLTFSEKYPLASGEDAADLLITTSAGNIYLLAVGYEV